MDPVVFLGDEEGARAALGALGPGSRFLFSLVISYTGTSETPGISAAGASPESMRLTPAADAEYIRLGRCESLGGLPMSPGGLPTPALLTRTALEAARIPSMTINAGAAAHPRVPYVETGLAHGEDIAQRPAMARESADAALARGREAGRHAAEISDCVIIGESVPGGTTTALGVMRGLGIGARVSSSMPENPVGLKERAVGAALARLGGGAGPRDVLCEAGDPMLGFVCAMAASASQDSRVLLAGGTQMMAAFLLARRLCDICEENVVVATTSYVARDPSANLAEIAGSESVPVAYVDPRLELSGIAGLRAFAHGHAKEGAGAGGAIIAAVQAGALSPGDFPKLAEAEYACALSHGH